jgi:hypothetical protein
MRRVLIAVLVIALTISLTGLAFAGSQTHDNKKLSIGGSYHKPHAGVNLNYLEVKWDETGVNFFRYQIATWKGQFTLNDVYLVEDGKVIYKRSAEKKLGFTFSFTDLTDSKYFFDREHLTNPASPFTFGKGQVWWLVSYEQDGKTEDAVIIWNIADNSIDWKPYEK